MTKDKAISAAEAARLLRDGQEYQARLQAHSEREARVRAEEAALLDRLRAMGYQAESLQDLLAANVPLSRELAEALVEALASAKESSLQDTLIRALGAAGESFDLQPLVRFFEGTPSESLRWAVANTFAQLRPFGLRVWLLEALQTPLNGRAREMLALAVARTCAPSDANPVLLKLLDELPGHAALALAESGSAHELPALRLRLASAKGWEKREIDKAIRAISRRS